MQVSGSLRQPSMPRDHWDDIECREHPRASRGGSASGRDIGDPVWEARAALTMKMLAT